MSNEDSTAITDAIDLGVILGQSQTCALIAGRCSAAQAATLQKLRDGRKYKVLNPIWEDFCKEHLKISRSEADKIIRLWQEFGAGYFEISNLTGISPETYRAIAPSISEGAIHCNGEAIELNLDNSRKVAAAVAELRRALPAPAPRPVDIRDRIAALDKRCDAVVHEFEEMASEKQEDENWLLLTLCLERTYHAIQRLAQANAVI